MPKDNELNEALEAALDKKARDLVVIDVAEICSFADNLVICTGTSNRHNQTIAEGIEEHLRGLNVRPLHIEGQTQAEWILMDYSDFIVHIFSPKTRTYYNLERLWRDAPRTEISD